MTNAPRRRPNAALKAVMVEAGLTQQELAECVNRKAQELFGMYGNCSDVHVRRWLSGSISWPNPRYLLPLEEVLDRSAIDLGFIPRGTDSVAHLARARSMLQASRSMQQENDPVRRRVFLGGLVAGTALTYAHGTLPTSGRIGMLEVSRLQASLTELHAHDGQHGGAALVRIAVGQYEQVREALESCTYGERVGRALYSAAGEFATSAGWFAFDSGDQDAAEQYHNKALRLSMLANDPTLQAHILAAMAIQSLHVGRGAECATIARAALDGKAARHNPLIASLFYARTAAGFARDGASRRLFARSFAQAERVLDRHHDGNGNPVPPWLAFFGPGELSGILATSQLALGRYKDAEVAAEETLKRIGKKYERNRFIYTLRQAEAQLGQRQVEQACSTAKPALEAMPRIRSSRGANRIRLFCRKLEAWAAEPAVREFTERYESFTRAASNSFA